MRRVFALGWVLGTSMGVLLGLFGVQLVSSGITDARVSPLSRPEVLQALQAGEQAAVPAAPETPPTTEADAGAVAPLTGPASPPAPVPPTSSPPRPGPGTGTPKTTVTTAAPPPPAPPPQATTPPAPPPPVPPSTGVTRTIASDGGVVAVRYDQGQVRLLWARPNDGYDVEVVRDGPAEVEVSFRSKGHRSQVRAFYENGQPAQSVEEKGRPVDDGGKGGGR